MRNPKVTKESIVRERLQDPKSFCFKMIKGCKTYEQVRGAIKYAILAGMRQEPIIDELIEFKLMTTNPNI